MNLRREQDDDAPIPADGARDRLLLTRKWAYLLSEIGFIPLSQEDLERELGEMVDALFADVLGEPFDTGRARAVGARLVELECTGDGSLERSVDVLGKGLTAQSTLPSERFSERITLCVAALACGYAEANWERALTQQESIKLSLLKAVRDARWNLQESEARFDGVATASSSGIVITDLDGEIVRVNGAVSEILGLTADELTGRNLFDVVHPDYGPFLRADYAAMLDGKRERIKQSQQLLHKDGDFARVTLTASLLRDTDGVPRQFVTVVEDGTELVLLQSELSRQARHDVLTGLPNRQFFGSHLEGAVQRADPQHGITVFHLDLEAFSVVGSGLGRRAAERLLAAVAQRLKVAVQAERAMVARFDGDEFGVLVENSASTPGLMAMVTKIREAVAEVTYVDGHGIAVAAGIGVVHRPRAGIDADELLRTAEVALRRAKASGCGQWERYDPEHDADEQRTGALAATMPGAWETGQLSVRYRPVAYLVDRRIAGMEALLHWEHPDLGPLGHERCVALAEHTGLILPLGAWLLKTAAAQTRWWWRGLRTETPPLVLNLTANQSCDADLVPRMLDALADSGLEPADLLIGMPVLALSSGTGASVANLGRVAALGCGVVLDGFGSGDLALVEDHPVHSVRVARDLVDRQAREPESTLATSLSVLPPLVHRAGARVTVDGIRTSAQAEWWRLADADTAVGDHFGAPSERMPE